MPDAHTLGPRAPLGRPWTADEDAFIRAHYERMDAHEIAAHLSRSTRAIEHRRWRALGLRKNRPWSPAEIELLRRMYADGTPSELLTNFPGRTAVDIREKTRELRIRALRQARLAWTAAEDQILKDLYPRTSVLDLMPKLPNRKARAILARAQRLGLSHSADFWAARQFNPNRYPPELREVIRLGNKLRRTVDVYQPQHS